MGSSRRSGITPWRRSHSHGLRAAADLPVFYNAASFMIYPSLFEGFGLPVIEAMACGTPVITSYGSSLEEIARELPCSLILTASHPLLLRSRR